uniref:sulfotransferase family protein n=1 Tax=Pseudotamlana agarivorans TaxID=481183 RepID=UPI0008304320
MPDNKWISKFPEQLPDFIIAGGMKCATTTMHAILDKHPDVFIPKGELHMFDIDDIFEHSDFNYYNHEKDRWYSATRNFNENWEAYHTKFKGNESKIKGEDSTSYLPSKDAFRRISLQKKTIKVIVMLRNPTSRAYSNYHHLLKSGRALYSFEDTIQYLPYTVLHKSMYKQQLENLYKYIPKTEVKIVIFEDFIKNPKDGMKEISNFLNIDFTKFKEEDFNTHANKGNIPRNVHLKYIFSRNFRGFGNKLYFNKTLDFKPKKDSFYKRLMFVTHNLLNPIKEGKPEKIKISTKVFLDEYFLKELEGLDELIEMPVLNKW